MKLFLKSFLILILLITVFNVSALTGSIDEAKVVITANVTPNRITEITKQLTVRNPNDEQVKINLVPLGDLENLIIIHENNFVLEPRAFKTVAYTIRLNESGQYSGAIGVSFSSLTENIGVALQSIIQVDANEVAEQKKTLNGLIIAILALVILLIVLVAVLRRKKKKEHMDHFISKNV